MNPETSAYLLRSHIEQATDGPHWQRSASGKALAIVVGLALIVIVALAVN